MEDARWYFTTKRKRTDCGIALFLLCAENSACHGRRPVKSRGRLLRKILESIMNEKKQSMTVKPTRGFFDAEVSA